MRILFASHSQGVTGGAEETLLDLVGALHRDGRVRPIVTVPAPGALAEHLAAAGIESRVVATPWWAVSTRRLRDRGRSSGATFRARRTIAIAAHYSPPIDPAKVRIVHIGIPGYRLRPVEPHRGRLRMLLLGSQTTAKGSDLAVAALVALEDEPLDLSLRLVGPATTSYRAHLERLVAEQGLSERVELVDYVADPTSQLEWCDVLLQCSRDEGFGRVTAEALKSGRPVIGARSGATPELVADGVDGLLFAPGDPQSLAAAIRTLACSPETLDRMAQAARDRNEDRFVLEAAVEAFVELFEQLGVR